MESPENEETARIDSKLRERLIAQAHEVLSGWMEARPEDLQGEGFVLGADYGRGDSLTHYEVFGGPFSTMPNFPCTVGPILRNMTDEERAHIAEAVAYVRMREFERLAERAETMIGGRRYPNGFSEPVPPFQPPQQLSELQQDVACNVGEYVSMRLREMMEDPDPLPPLDDLDEGLKCCDQDFSTFSEFMTHRREHRDRDGAGPGGLTVNFPPNALNATAE